MAGRALYPVEFPGHAPPIQVMQYNASETFKAGCPLKLNSAGEVITIATDDVVGIIGVAGQAVATNPGYSAANSPTVITYQQQTVSVFKASRGIVFSCRGVNGATDPVTPLLTHIGEQYGGLVDADGVWTLDFADTTHILFQIVGISTEADLKIFRVVFLESCITPI